MVFLMEQTAAQEEFNKLLNDSSSDESTLRIITNDFV